MENGEAIMEDSLEAPQKFKNRIVRWSRNPNHGHPSKIAKKRILKKYLHSLVHCITSHTS
jgi:hypothetical protein